MAKKGAKSTAVKTARIKKDSGVQKLKSCFEKNPNKVIDVDTLEKVSDIRDWTRTIRYIRDYYEMNIVYVRATDTTKAGYKYIVSKK